MKRQPILPKTDKSWDEDSNAYRKALHEDLYPKDQEWTPNSSDVSFVSVYAAYIRMARIWVFSMVYQGPTTASVGAYVDLPIQVSQTSIFNVAVDGVIKPAIIDKGSSRLYLPDWATSTRAIISGLATS